MVVKDVFHAFGADVEGLGIYVGEDWGGTDVRHHTGGGEEGEAWNNDPVAGTDPEGLKGEEEGIGAARDPDGVLHPKIFGDFPLECLHLRAENEAPRRQNSTNSYIDFLPYNSVLPVEIKERDSQGSLLL